MKVTTSYKIKIANYNNIFENTVFKYREALSYFIDVVNAEWDTIKDIELTNAKMTAIERMTHSTSKRTAKYDFDARFYKMPVYIRRAAIVKAIGTVSSFKSNYENWLTNGKNGKAPTLQLDHRSFPVLYRGNMFVREDDCTARIKLYHRNDWVWLTVKLRKSDVDYIFHHKLNSHESAPTLERRGKNWYLRFSFIDKVKLTEKNHIITAVDLGINTAAVCTAMLPDGTIIGRRFCPFPIEQDHIRRKLNNMKKAQQNGARKMLRLWAYANNYNRSLSEKTSKAIVEFAEEYGSDVIVMEHLDTKGKKRGSKKQRLHLWRKRAVFHMVTVKAHLRGMRVSSVNAWNTSRLAFDGSGRLERDKDNYSLCTFATGKRYNTDLNASYNIGARYFIRNKLKSLPETVGLALQAKVPALAKRTTCTLSDLISLNAELARLAA